MLLDEPVLSSLTILCPEPGRGSAVLRVALGRVASGVGEAEATGGWEAGAAIGGHRSRLGPGAMPVQSMLLR